MSYTMQNIVDRGRTPINDDDKVRFTDAALLVFAQDGILLLRNKRPDLFFGLFGTLSTTENLALDDTFPLNAEIVPALADYVTARAETKNDESVLTERAALFFNLVKGQV
jgi:hypothetical protein